MTTNHYAMSSTWFSPTQWLPAALVLSVLSTPRALAGSVDEDWNVWLTFRGSQLYGAAIARDSFDNLLVTGSDPLIGTIITAKYDQAGNQLWIQEFDHRKTMERASWITVDSQGNAIVCGYNVTSSGHQYGLVTLKYDPNGQLLWSDDRTTTRGYLLRVVTDAADNVLVLGTEWVTNSSGNTTDDLVTMKYDPNGVIQWIRHLGSDAFNADSGTAFAVRPNGNVVVAGGPIGSFLTAEYDSNGTLLWKRLSPASTNATTLALTPAGETVVAGGTYDRALGNLYLVEKYDETGNTLWSHTYAGSTARRVAVDSKGSIFVTGIVTSTHSAYTDWLTHKLSSSGTLQWSRIFDQADNNDEVPYFVMTGSHGEAYLTGQASKGSGSYLETVTLRYASDGTEEWSSTNDLSLRGLGLVRAGDGSVAVVGESVFSIFHLQQHPLPLALEMTPSSVSAGNTLTAEAQNGSPTFPLILSVVGINGDPVFVPVFYGTFDAAGTWSTSSIVPPGLSGLILDFRALGFGEIGKVEWSNAQSVTFL